MISYADLRAVGYRRRERQRSRDQTGIAAGQEPDARHMVDDSPFQKKDSRCLIAVRNSVLQTGFRQRGNQEILPGCSVRESTRTLISFLAGTEMFP